MVTQLHDVLQSVTSRVSRKFVRAAEKFPEIPEIAKNSLARQDGDVVYERR